MNVNVIFEFIGFLDKLLFMLHVPTFPITNASVNYMVLA